MWGRSPLAAMTTAWTAATLLTVSNAQPSRAQDVVVRFDPPMQTVSINDVFTVDMLADITAPVVAWGLDVTLSLPSIASTFAAPNVPFPPWIAATTADGDGLAGLADPFAPTNGSVTGTGILLATLTFRADAEGMTDLIASTTPGDQTEGFPLDPTGFANVTFEPGQIIIIPEPATVLPLLCALFGGLGGVRARRRKRRKPPIADTGL